MSYSHTFSGNPLDRADRLRRDETQIAAAAADPESRFLLFNQLKVAVNRQTEPQLGWLPGAVLTRLLGLCPTPVLLGLHADRAHFALDSSQINLSELDLAAAGYSPEHWQFEDCRLAAMSLPAGESGIVAQARSQLDWHQRHGFCSACGATTRAARGGHVRLCERCNAQHFPRTDPVAIMLIVDGDFCLLGQSAGRLAATRTFSALAGFIDQGESIEEAVRREVLEEAGIPVGQVHYHSSQPWPFPSSLMIGCHGQALDREIHMDEVEMTAVEWFHRDQIQTALEVQQNAGASTETDLRLPGPIAIAHHLLLAWVRNQIPL